MKFRDMEIDDVIIIGPFVEKLFIKKLKELHEEYTVIDLQYAIINTSPFGHSALALVKKINEYEEPYMPK